MVEFMRLISAITELSDYNFKMAPEGGLTSDATDRILETFKIDSLKELQHRGLEALIKGQYVFIIQPIA